MRACYLGPMVIVSRNQGGTYIICKLDSTLLHSLIMPYWAVPYFAQDYLKILDLQQHVDVSVAWLCALEQSTVANPDLPERAIEDISNIGDEQKPKIWRNPMSPMNNLDEFHLQTQADLQTADNL